MLSPEQIDNYQQQGFVLLEHAVSKSLLRSLTRSFDAWVELSRQHGGPFGKMLDGRPRFDVEPGHSFDSPALRRIAAPEELSAEWLGMLQQGAFIEAAACIIGPDIRFHHAKLNSKMPGSGSVVKWHQDFPFDPYTNDDCVTAMLYLDDVSNENGAPKIVPESHRGSIHSLWHNGVFIGAAEDKTARECESSAVECTGPAGSVCLMHTRALHGSTINRTSSPRTLFIANLTSADAIPLSPNPVPSVYSGQIVYGKDPGKIRVQSQTLEAPEIPSGASFFNQQSQQGM